MPFTPETLIQCLPAAMPADAGKSSRFGVKRIGDIRATDRVLTGRGEWQSVADIRTETYEGPVFSFGEGRVTPDTLIANGPDWQAASETGKPRETFSGIVYDLLIGHEAGDEGSTPYTDRSLTLSNGITLRTL